MSITEFIKIYTHLASKCCVNKLHFSFNITDGVTLEWEIWKDSPKFHSLIKKEVNLKKEDLRYILLEINETITNYKLNNGV